jgi:hypothetical protein
MSSAVEQHVIYQIANSPLREYPYPHLYVESIFPDAFYRSIRRNWPASSSLVSLASTGRVSPGVYAERFIMQFAAGEIEKLPPEQRDFWSDFHAWFVGDLFLHALLNKFSPYVLKRFGAAMKRYYFEVDSLIVRDHVNYQLGPHTDSPHKLLSLLFYCPDDESNKHLGTSIYTPIDPNFRCPGGPHHSKEQFNLVKTMEYRPNSLFAFFKTDNSFHGVETLTDQRVLRDLLLYDVRARERPQAAADAGEPRIGWQILKHLFGKTTRH